MAPSPMMVTGAAARAASWSTDGGGVSAAGTYAATSWRTRIGAHEIDGSRKEVFTFHHAAAK